MKLSLVSIRSFKLFRLSKVLCKGNILGENEASTKVKLNVFFFVKINFHFKNDGHFKLILKILPARGDRTETKLYSFVSLIFCKPNICMIMKFYLFRAPGFDFEPCF